MTLLLTWLLYSSGCLLIFWLVYYAWLRHLTFYRWNRIYLLATLALSMVIPLLEKPVFGTAAGTGGPALPGADLPGTPIVLQPAIAAGGVTAPVASYWMNWLTACYFVGLVIMAAGFMYGIIRILLLVRHNRHERRNNVTLVYTPWLNASFFRFIFLQQELPADEEAIIFQHENAHRRQLHSWDILLMELAKVIFWFNPLMYRYLRELKQVHECEADQMVTATVPKTEYADMLLRFNTRSHLQRTMLFNLYSEHPLKKRVHFLFNHKSTNMKKALYLFALPCLAIAVSSFSAGIVKKIPTATVVTREIKLPAGAKFENDDNKIILQLEIPVLLGKDKAAAGFDALLESEGWKNVLSGFEQNGLKLGYKTKANGPQLEEFTLSLQFKDGSSASSTYTVKELEKVNYRFIKVSFDKKTSDINLSSIKKAVI